MVGRAFGVALLLIQTLDFHHPIAAGEELTKDGNGIIDQIGDFLVLPFHTVTISPSGFRNPLPFLHNLTLLCCDDCNQSALLYLSLAVSCLCGSFTSALDTDMNGRMRMS